MRSPRSNLPSGFHLSEFLAAGTFLASLTAVGLTSVWILSRWGSGPANTSPSALDSLPARITALVVLIGGVALALWARVVEPRLLSVSHLNVPTGKVRSPLRLVFLSDLHVERGWLMRKRLPAAIAAQTPDAILLGGDYLNSRRPPARETLAGTIADLVATASVFAVQGNGERIRPDGLRIVEQNGARALRGDCAEIGDRIAVSGIGFLDAEALDRCAALLDRERFNICLTHEPSLMSQAARAGFELFLAGHTHGGQVRLPVYGALLTLAVLGKRVEMGRYELGGAAGYVTRGVGLEGGFLPRVRFLCRPEIVVIDIVPRIGG